MIYDILNNVRDKILAFTGKKFRNNFLCDDYKEFLQLIVMFFGRKLQENVNLRQPVAYNLARWMAKGIYCLNK